MKRALRVLAATAALALCGPVASQAQGYWPQDMPRGTSSEIYQGQRAVDTTRQNREADFQRQQSQAARAAENERDRRAATQRDRNAPSGDWGGSRR